MRRRHGGDVYGNPGVSLDFSVNVNPLGMPDFIRRAACKGVESSDRYPDSRCRGARSLISGHYRVGEEQIIFGNGAAELIFSAVRAIEPQRAALLAPSFLEYESALKSTGATVDHFYLKEEAGFVLPVEEYLAFLEEKRPQMIFLCSPSNPVGTLISREEMDRILEYCERKQIFAVVDECFLEFLEAPDQASAVKAVRNGMERLLVIQALTKTFAMAGLRFGYGFTGSKSLAGRILDSLQPWNVSIPAQEAAEAAFGPERESYLRDTRRLLEVEKPLLKAGLEEADFKVYDGVANFLFFKDRRGSKEALYHWFLSRGILIRSCGNFQGLDGTFYRICVKKKEENRKFLENLAGYK